ncbi:ABC-type branched-subunit amino acid transport system ATPase component [Paenarthrobacter histidinolovorans]|uniref:ABC-type branched-subunit amino acid transport system ATPase component n=1 Tax=Paenarthrobacter histidinolovorans TaxID=43664 RepID=A0ABW8NCN7_9MICC
MIEIKSLSKKYGQSDGIIDVSLTAEPGKVTAFLGPNGAGKSTTFRLLLGLDRADSGSALIEGKPYRDLIAPPLDHWSSVRWLRSPQGSHSQGPSHLAGSIQWHSAFEDR